MGNVAHKPMDIIEYPTIFGIWFRSKKRVTNLQCGQHTRSHSSHRMIACLNGTKRIIKQNSLKKSLMTNPIPAFIIDKDDNIGGYHCQPANYHQNSMKLKVKIKFESIDSTENRLQRNIPQTKV